MILQALLDGTMTEEELIAELGEKATEDIKTVLSSMVGQGLITRRVNEKAELCYTIAPLHYDHVKTTIAMEAALMEELHKQPEVEVETLIETIAAKGYHKRAVRNLLQALLEQESVTIRQLICLSK